MKYTGCKKLLPKAVKNTVVSTMVYFVLMLVSAQAQQPVPPPAVREADVMFSKREWRIIDLRERANKVASWPKNPITRILYEGVRTGQLKPYKTDSLKSAYNIEAFMKRGLDVEYVETPIDPNDPTITRLDTIVSPFDPEQGIKQLLVMEDWYFDKKLGTMIPRIIAIAPLFRMKVAGIDLGLQPLCWLRFEDRFEKEKDVRDLLVNQYMFNAQNSHSKFSYDDWFRQRLFGSYVVKTSNLHDVSILQDPTYKKSGLEALIEAERIRQQNYEEDANMFEE